MPPTFGTHLSIDPATVDRPDSALRIACLLPTLNPYGGVISVVNAVNIMLDQGHHVTLASLSRTGNHLVQPRTEPVFIEDPKEIVRLMGTNYDIALATSWETVAPVLQLVAGNPVMRPCYFVQGLEADLFSSQIDKQRVLETYARIETRIVKTRYLAARLAEHGFDSHRIPPGMDLDIFYPRSGAPSTRSRRVVAMARPGAAEDHRGYQVLIDAMRRLSDLSSDTEITLFGSDELPADLGFPFENAGRVAPEALPAIYSSAAVFVDTSLFHGFGRTGVEAMACSCACVLSDSGGISEYAVAGENAEIVPVGDAAATAEVIAGLLDDPDRMDALAARGREKVQGFSDYAAVDAILEILRSTG